MAVDQSIAAFCEDYNSDNSETVPDTRKQANVAAKRSHPSDLGKTPTVRTAGRDAASDSGYSSHTAATLGSADLQSPPAPPPASSAQRQQQNIGPNSASSTASDGIRVRAKANSDSGSSTAKRRSNNSSRPSMRPDGRSQSKSSSSGGASATMPTSPMGSSRAPRSESQTRRTRQQGRAEQECPDPSCACRHDRRRAPSSPGGRPNLGLGSVPPYAGMHHPHPSPSPRTQRYSGGFGPMIVESSQPPQRTGLMPRTRPMSFHAGMSQEAFRPNTMGFGAHPDLTGPPPSFSAYTNQPQPPHVFYGQPNMNPPPMPYQPLHPGQNRPPMPDHARGMPPQQRPALDYSTRTPTSTFAPPQIHCEPPTPGFLPAHAGPNSNPSMRWPSARPSGQMFHPPPMSQPPPEYDSSTSESSSESDDDGFAEEDSRSMPPPPGPMPRRRPEMRHAATVNYPVRPTAREVKVHPSTRTYVIDDSRSNPASASSSRRPSLVHHRTKSKTYVEAGATATVESSTSRRRMSYQSHEQRSAHVDGAQRAAEAYQADVAAQASSSRRRRDTDGARDARKGSNRRSVIIDGHRVDSTVPLTEEALRKAKPTTRLETPVVAPSEAGSGRSKTSSSRNSNNDSRSTNIRRGLEGRTLSGGSSGSKALGNGGSGGGDAAAADDPVSPVQESLSVQINGWNVELQGKTLSFRTQDDDKPQLVVGGVGEQHAVPDRVRHRERARESSHRAPSRSRGAVGSREDYDDEEAERERRSRRRRSSIRTESYSRPTNNGAGAREAPTVASSSTTSSSATSRGSLHRDHVYRNEDDGTREYYSPRRANPVRYPSARPSYSHVVPVVHSRRSGERLPNRSRSPRRSRSRYRSQSRRNATTTRTTSRMRQPAPRHEPRHVGSEEDSSDGEDTTREYHAPSSSSSLATAYMYTERNAGVSSGAAAAVAANALKNNRESHDRYAVDDTVSIASGSAAATGSGTAEKRTGLVGRLRGKYEERVKSQWRGSNSRSRQQAGRPVSVVGSAPGPAVYDRENDEEEEDTDSDDETSNGHGRGGGGVHDWI